MPHQIHRLLLRQLHSTVLIPLEELFQDLEGVEENSASPDSWEALEPWESLEFLHCH